MQNIWNDAPSWARFITEDKNGIQLWHAERPVLDNTGVWWPRGQTAIRWNYGRLRPNPNWKTSILEKPVKMREKQLV